MPASFRRSASQPWMISPNGFERWLISRTDMPTPGSAMRSRCTCSRTGSGSTAGPAAKLRIRSVVAAIYLSLPGALGLRELIRRGRGSQRHHADVENLGIAAPDPAHERVRRLPFDVDARDRGLRTGDDDVLGFLG